MLNKQSLKESTMLIAGEYTNIICNHLNLKTFDIEYKEELEISNFDFSKHGIKKVVILDTALSSLMKWETFIEFVSSNPTINFELVTRYNLITHGRLDKLNNLTIKTNKSQTLDPLKLLFEI